MLQSRSTLGFDVVQKNGQKSGGSNLGQLFFLLSLLAATLLGLYQFSNKNNSEEVVTAAPKRPTPEASPPPQAFVEEESAKPALALLEVPPLPPQVPSSAPAMEVDTKPAAQERWPQFERWPSPAVNRPFTRRIDDVDPEWLETVAEAQGISPDQLDFYRRRPLIAPDVWQELQAAHQLSPEGGKTEGETAPNLADNKQLLGLLQYGGGGGSAVPLPIPTGRQQPPRRAADDRPAGAEREKRYLVTPKLLAQEEKAEAGREVPSEEAEEEKEPPCSKPLPPFMAIEIDAAGGGLQVGKNGTPPTPGAELTRRITGLPDAWKPIFEDDWYPAKEKVLELGIDGQVTLTFLESGFLRDVAGDDFYIYMSNFPPVQASQAANQPHLIYLRPARVAVYGEGRGHPLGWYFFPCQPVAPFSGCAGTAGTFYNIVSQNPKAFGGNGFDLDQLGLRRAYRIRIEDLTSRSGATTDGLSIDSLGFIEVCSGRAAPTRKGKRP